MIIWILAGLLWWLIGFSSMLYTTRTITDITVGDLIAAVTLGGIGGLVTVLTSIIWLSCENNLFDKVLIKKAGK